MGDPVPSSGMISLNDFHIAAGGTTGTACNLNEADIRGLIDKASGAAMNFAEWYGASASIHGTAISAAYVDGQYFDQSGYREGVIGSMTDDAIDSFQNSSVCKITQTENLAGTFNLTISVSSGSKTFNNSGFTTLNLYLGQTTNSGSPDVELDRVDATFSNGTNFGRWAWDVATLGGNTSPTFVNGIFGTSTTNNFVELV
jgi:hypothetical protein